MYNSLIKILYISICLAINNISLCYDACYSCIRFFGIGTFSTHALSSFFLINDANTVRLNYADIIRHRGSPYDTSNGARIRVAFESHPAGQVLGSGAQLAGSLLHFCHPESNPKGVCPRLITITASFTIGSTAGITLFTFATMIRSLASVPDATERSFLVKNVDFA